MSSNSFNEPSGDKVGRTNGSGTRMAPARASSQVIRPAPKLNVKRLESIGRNLLLAIGEDPTRDGLKMTPNRFARWWKEFIDYDPGGIETTFAFESFRTDQMVVCAGVPVFSLCEHHLLPFKCEISMAYIASEHVLGLSKFARIAHKYSHRLQVQERLVHQIADEITAITDARDVAVLARGEHLCMQMRGIKSDRLMSTSRNARSLQKHRCSARVLDACTREEKRRVTPNSQITWGMAIGSAEGFEPTCSCSS